MVARLTGIKEQATGLIGLKPTVGKTMGGRPKVYFELGIGVENLEKLQYSTWRHCIAYDENALKLENVDKGSRVFVFGWVITQALYDRNGKPVIENESVVKREYLIAFKFDTAVQVLSYDKQQEQLPFELIEPDKQEVGAYHP